MNNIFQILERIFFIIGITFMTGIPFFILLYFKIEYLKNDKLIKNNTNLALEIKKLYNKLLTTNNFNKQKNNKIKNIMSLSNNYLIIFYGILYIITLILMVILKDKFLIPLTIYIIFTVLLFISYIVFLFMFDTKYSFEDSYYEIVLLPFLEKYFPNYVYSQKSNALKDDYKFSNIKGIPDDAIYFYKDQINYNLGKNKVILNDLKIEKSSKELVNGKRYEISTTYFDGISGKMILDKKINVKDIIISSSNLLENKELTFLDENKKYKVLKDDKERIVNLLNKDTMNKLNILVKKYKFDFYITDGSELYFRINTDTSIASHEINEVDFTARLIKIHNLYKEIELVLNEFLDIIKYIK